MPRIGSKGTRLTPGDLVIYSNPQRMVPPTLGIILTEEYNIAVDSRFFWVLLSGGTKKLITDHYLVKT